MEIVVFCTTPDTKTAEAIAQKLVENGLAACCNLIPGLTSIYTWKGKVQKDAEVLMMIKTDDRQYQKLEQTIKELHPYEVPEVIALDIKRGSKDYLKWIQEVVSL
ncbi:CutA1 divalent ion tolerance protein [Caldithrix abyssi DSM 13497]|uniref:CutA1 divalent ion tolerance protein n=1 Tax=Caldithrix abyssi DSM 13497 TaxID=880073 RepID=H1XTA2_CALAY|nr:divalent-cation tolerance protein CutA [Caldithrix abyssi]EHO42669.1 CutA1 divalent ion tolerance protein [Caldithrix abyssi DSM 13497]